MIAIGKFHLSITFPMYLTYSQDVKIVVCPFVTYLGALARLIHHFDFSDANLKGIPGCCQRDLRYFFQ